MSDSDEYNLDFIENGETGEIDTVLFEKEGKICTLKDDKVIQSLLIFRIVSTNLQIVMRTTMDMILRRVKEKRSTK